MLPTPSTATPGLALSLSLYALTGQRGGTRCLGDIGKEAEACSRQSGALHLAFTLSRVCTPALPRFSPHTDEVRQTFPTQAAKKGVRGELNQLGVHRAGVGREQNTVVQRNSQPCTPVWPAKVLLKKPASCPSCSLILWLRENLEWKYIFGNSGSKPSAPGSLPCTQLGLREGLRL